METNNSKVNISIWVIDWIARKVSFITVFAAISIAVVAMFIYVYNTLLCEPTIYEATVVAKQEEVFMTRTGGFTTPTIYVDVDGCILDTTVSDDIYVFVEVNDTIEVKVWDVFGKHRIMKLHNIDSIFDNEVSTE